MYAIFVDGGRQYRVQPGQTLDIDFREGSETGDSLKFERSWPSEAMKASSWARQPWLVPASQPK